VKIEILYLPDCPHYPAAMAELRNVLAAEQISAEIREVSVSDARMAEALRFKGSPTIRIDGRDVAEEPEKSNNFAMSCRLYAGAKQPGVPPAEMIQRAVREACGEEKP
jgi:hypothetical protein